MSFDVSFRIDTGGQEPTYVGENGLNHTSNCNSMFVKALGGRGIVSLHDMLCKDAIPSLRAAIEDMRRDPKAYEAMNPPNGWGGYDTAVRFLEIILENAEAHPKATIRVWY